ncbi:SbcC/MukB-like Walker B domain-containing protein [Spirosoma luteolum]
MIPLKLSIQGLYSYQTLQEVDFRQLTSASVFGIFGKVGSGKTSLLEAMSFALYGRTERLNMQDRLLYNMMNLKSKHLIIDFEFQAGPDGEQYKFVYAAKRHAKRHQDILAGERRSFKRQGDSWTPIGNEKEDISILSEQILGLNYDNFKRTIIIPQNQFREFLELSPTDRTRMMNQLFRLDQYDLASRTSRLKTANNTQLSELRGLLAPLAAITETSITDAKTQLADLLTKQQQQTALTLTLEPARQQLLQAQKLHIQLDAATLELQELDRQKPQFDALRQHVQRYEQCLLLFKSDLAALDKNSQQRQQAITVWQQATQQHERLIGSLPRLETDYKAAQQAYDTRDQLLQQRDELDTVAQIRNWQMIVNTQLDRYQKHKTSAADFQSQLDRMRREREEQQLRLQTLAVDDSALTRLYEAKEWFTVYESLKKRTDSLKAQLDDYDKNINQLKQAKDAALVGFKEDWQQHSLKDLPSHIQDAIEQLEHIRAERAEAYRAISVQAELQAYANALRDGAPCPLCGSAHHPAAAHLMADDAAVARARESLQKVEERIKAMQQLQLTINTLLQQLRAELSTGKKLIQERGELVAEQTRHEDAFVWTEFSKEPDGSLTKAIANLTDRKNQYRQAQQTITDLTSQIEQIDQKRQEEETNMTRIETAVSGLNGQIKDRVESLEHFKFDEVAEWDEAQLTDLRNNLTRDYDRAKAIFEAANKARQEASAELARLTELTKQLQIRLDELDRDQLALDKAVAHNLAHTGMDRDDVVQLLQQAIDVEAEHKRLKQFDDGLAGYRKQVADLSKALQQNPYDADALRTLEAELAKLKGEQDALNQLIGQAHQTVESLTRQWEQKKTYQAEHDKLDLRRQDLEDMEKLFRQAGFVNYVSSVYLKNLCESANERFFKLTNNQLRLELDEKNTFLVRDFMNNGELRSVKTLSGGQTFQASLSLALALSDNIRHLTQATQNLFFLDEGFGTLDKDSLQTVFQTLKALRAENRVVGIISHVEELQHEVDHYVRAEITDEGSRIRCSWEL